MRASQLKKVTPIKLISKEKAQYGNILKKAGKAASEVKIPPKLKASLKKSQAGPTKIHKFSSEAERIAAGHPTNLQRKKAGLSGYDRTPRKGPSRDQYGFDIRPDKNGGKITGYKSGGKMGKCKGGC